MRLWTVREVAEQLQCCPGTVYALCARGVLPHHRIGPKRGAIRVSDGQLAEFLHRSAAAAPPAAPAVAETPKRSRPAFQHLRLP